MSKCKSCGREVIFAVDKKGTTQILDTVAPVYRWSKLHGFPGTVVKIDCERAVNGSEMGYLVSHFSTCPNASSHSKGKDAAAGKEVE